MTVFNDVRTLLATKDSPETLSVVGDLDLADLPDGRLPRQTLVVDGDLNLKRCPWVRELPLELRVTGNLTVAGCMNLQRIKHAIVGKVLNASECGSLISIRDIQVGHDKGDLTIDISDGAHPPMLDLSGCTALQELVLDVPGYTPSDPLIILTGCSSITPDRTNAGCFPVRLQVRGPSVPHWFQGCEFQESLDLSESFELRTLPADLVVRRTLNLEGCRSLRELEPTLRVGETLNITDCEALMTAPSYLAVGKLIANNLDDPSPAWLRHLRWPGDLKLGGSFRHLPEDLVVEGTLDVSWCEDLLEIPSRLFVGKNLRLAGCKALRKIPADLVVMGTLDLSLCENLEPLPSSVTAGRIAGP